MQLGKECNSEGPGPGVFCVEAFVLYPAPLFFVSVASKRLNNSVGSLECAVAVDSVSVASKEPKLT